MNRNELSQEQKYLWFKKAFRTYNTHIENENYIAAYVIGFSILEDRINALFYTRKQNESENSEGYFRHYKKLTYLNHHNDISDVEMEEWKKEGDKRNNKIHAAMWRVDEFSEEDCTQVIAYARDADRLRREQKKSLGI